jgi:putative hydrolase of the HAD superfamily
MVLIFDLDDTLYSEMQFVKSGFLAVAKELQNLYNLPFLESYSFMLKVLNEKGRGSVFNDLLNFHGKFSIKNLNHCIKIYRHHKPDIELNSNVHLVLSFFPGNKYVVTDGHKIVQENKVKALRISTYFKHIYITHRYGIINSKPSIYCFDLIRRKEKCEWSDMCYIGDNPNKDFVNLKPLGVRTIRIQTGIYDTLKISELQEAEFIISNINEIKSLNFLHKQ